MNTFKIKLFVSAVLFATTSAFMTSCKSKKAAPVVEQAAPAPAPAPAPEPAKPVEAEKEVAPEPAKAIEYRNIQFEFNSSVLKTSSYAVLDQIAAGMKRFPELKFQINGHASAEGTEARNLALSVDRANAVKNYLVNNGIAASVLTTVGNGEKFPVAPNNTEEGRVLNRRVEIKPAY